MTNEADSNDTRVWEVFKQELNFVAGDRWESTRKVRVPAGAILAGLIPSASGATLLYTLPHPTPAEAEQEAAFDRLVELEKQLTGDIEAMVSGAIADEPEPEYPEPEDPDEFERALARMQAKAEESEGGSNDDIDG